MNPSQKPRSLFFTPRTPWGRFPQHRTGPMAPAAPVQPPKAPPAAQMTPYAPRPAASDKDIVRQPGNAAPTVKQQLQRDIDWNRKQGFTSDRDLTLQQKYERDNLMRDTFQPKPAPQQAGLFQKILSHVDGDVSYEGTHPGTDERPDKELRVRFSSNPTQRGEMPGSGPPEKNQGDEASRKYLYPAESPEEQPKETVKKPAVRKPAFPPQPFNKTPQPVG